MARSESNIVKLNGSGTYPDLNMTHYPDKVDSRVDTDTGYNPNMKGFSNRKDYNIAEHVNALADAVMAVERSLGIKPYLTKDGVDKTTVGGRITAIESVDYDPRYGGTGWDTTQTLVGHTHNGAAGGPAKISLTGEVIGALPKTNLNLNYLDTNGLTGSDISISKDRSTSINAAVNDKLSLSQGGTIEKDLRVKGKTRSAFYADIFSSDSTSSDASLVADVTARTQQALKIGSFSGTGTWRTIIDYKDHSLQYGRYIACIRAKVSKAGEDEVVLSMRPYSVLSAGFSVNGQKEIRGTDFKAANQWQTFYTVFDYKGDMSSSHLNFIVSKHKTSTAYDVYFDYVHICPAHPAIYDM